MPSQDPPTSEREQRTPRRGQRTLCSTLRWSFEWSLVLGTPFLGMLLIVEGILLGKITPRPFVFVGSVLFLANVLLAMDTIQGRRCRPVRKRGCPP